MVILENKKLLLISGSVGIGGDNKKEDIKRVTSFLESLGYTKNLKKETGETNEQWITNKLGQTIKSIQTMIAGSAGFLSSKDGRIDKYGTTHTWLNALNAPLWTSIHTLSELGVEKYTGVEEKRGSYVNLWIHNSLLKIGEYYHKNYIKDKTSPFPKIQINKCSTEIAGAENKPHKGHRVGLDCDIRIVRGTSPSFLFGGNYYDSDSNQDVNRAILKSINNASSCKEIYFNDPTLISEKLCKKLDKHNNHIHITIKVPNRESQIVDEINEEKMLELSRKFIFPENEHTNGIIDFIIKESKKYGVNPNLVFALILSEEGGDLKIDFDNYFYPISSEETGLPHSPIKEEEKFVEALKKLSHCVFLVKKLSSSNTISINEIISRYGGFRVNECSDSKQKILDYYRIFERVVR